MLRKLVVAGGGVLLLSILLFGRDAASYVTTTFGWMKDSVRESVPVEFEIERARKMISELQPEIRRNMHLIAKEEVEVERLQKQVESMDERLARDQNDIARLREHLDSGKDSLVLAGRRYSETDVRADLVNRFARYKTNDATLENLEKVLRARQLSLEAARKKLEEMLSARRSLIVDVENLEARRKMVEVAQTTSDFNFDDSRLARTKELITNIRTRIDVAEKMVNADAVFHDEIPLEEPVGEDIAAQIDEYFNGGSAEVSALVDKD